MTFNHYYDFEDCFQMSGGTGTTLTYVVGSNEELTEGNYNIIFSISNPNQRVCGENMTASTSTAATHYSGVVYEFDNCGLCLSANTQIISVSGITNWNGGDLTLVADSRYIKGDIIHIDIIYDLSGTTTYINSPAQIINVSPYTSTGSSIPNLIFYIPYDSFQQVFESKGVYYLVEDCSGGTQSVILSKQELLYQNTVINLPYGNSPCKFVVTALTQGDYSEISGVTAILSSSIQYNNCLDCLSSLYSGVLSDDFEQNTYDALTINDLKQLNDGTIVVGGAELSAVDNGDLFNFGNILKLNQDGSLNLSFNPNNEGSLTLNGSTFIYSNYDEKFNFSENFSVEFWFKLGKHDTDGGIISFKDVDDNGWEIRFDGNDNYIIFDYNGDLLTSVTELNSDEWYHIAVVNDCDEGDLIMYINGSDDITTGCTSGLTASAETIFKVGVNKTLDSYVTGLITNVRIVNGNDNFAYEGSFIPQTYPLRNRQNGYDNIRTIDADEVVLLLNFSDKYTTLFDSSVYKIPFYVNNPSVQKTSTSKCRCVSYLNTGPATVFNYYNCFEAGTINPSPGLQSVSLGAGQTSSSVCMDIGSVNMNQNPNLTLVNYPYTSNVCVLLSSNQYLCPGPCNCNSVKNNTTNTIELRYYDCTRQLVVGNFITAGAPEIQVCAIYFEPSSLTIVNQNYQCSATTVNWPYNFQCLPPIDARCSPIYVDYCYSTFAPNNTGAQPGPITAWYSLGGLLGNTSLALPSPQNTPITHNAGARYQIDIAHTLNYDTNTGRLWILHTNNSTFISTPNQPYFIDQWALTFTVGVGFTTVYTRRITIGAALTLGGINWGPGSGMAARDNNTLIVSRFSTTSLTIPTDIVQLNISANGNINLTTANVITLFTLPATGSLININDSPTGNINNPINISAKIIVSGGMTLTDNNRLIIKCKLGANPAGNVDHILLQYTLAGVLEHARRLDGIGLTIAFSSAVFSYNQTVMIERTTGTNPGTWSVLNYNGTNVIMTGALGGQTVPIPFPNLYSLTGPMGASSPRSVGGTAICPTVDLPINVV